MSPPVSSDDFSDSFFFLSFVIFHKRACTDVLLGNFVEQYITELAAMKQQWQQFAPMYQLSIKRELFIRPFTIVCRSLRYSGCPPKHPCLARCYCSCLLRTALRLPGTYSLVQHSGQLAGRVFTRACWTCACTCKSFMPVVSRCTAIHVCLCTVYIGVCVCVCACQLKAMCELSAKRAILLPPCYWLTAWLGLARCYGGRGSLC